MGYKHPASGKTQDEHDTQKTKKCENTPHEAQDTTANSESTR